jgi:hypothetical protein
MKRDLGGDAALRTHGDSDEWTSVGYLLELLTPPPWHADAVCKVHPDVDWFSHSATDEAFALAICAECPVRAECLAYAVERGERFGVWGGMTARQRRRLRARPAA